MMSWNRDTIARKVLKILGYKVIIAGKGFRAPNKNSHYWVVLRVKK